MPPTAVAPLRHVKVLTILGTRPGDHPTVARHREARHDVSTTSWSIRDRTTIGLAQRRFLRASCRCASPTRALAFARRPFGAQIGAIIARVEEVFSAERPDRVLILGDTNSGLAAIAAKRLGIPVFHMEAGNRCFDDRVPEEVNRRIIDHSSDVLMPYTERSRANLLREGFAGDRIFVIGNPIFEVFDAL